MPETTDTRGRLLDTAGELFRRQGYHGTGLNQVVAESRTPKGSLYFHFPGGKQQLAAESIDLAAERLRLAIEAALASTPDPAAAVAGVAELLAGVLESSGFREGCPVAVVALEAAGESEPIRAACAGAYGSWLAIVDRHLRAAGVAEAEAADLADLVLSSFEGAMLLARLRRDAGVLRSVAGRVGAVLRAATPERAPEAGA
jgi:TetR/AcrR family transcriptional regulator, lmrAB and yxaGH operons repressor